MLTSFYLPTSYLNSPSLRISPKCAYELLLRVAKHDGAASQGGGLPNFQVNVFQAWKKTKYICQNNPTLVLSYYKIFTKTYCWTIFSLIGLTLWFCSSKYDAFTTEFAFRWSIIICSLLCLWEEKFLLVKTQSSDNLCVYL